MSRSPFKASRLAGSYLLYLPMCPSTNDRMTHNRYTGRPILTTKARDYMSWVRLKAGAWLKAQGIAKISTRTDVSLWMVLPNRNCDPHNYEKVLFDALEKAGVCTNDKHLLPRYRGIEYDTKETCIVVEVPCS